MVVQFHTRCFGRLSPVQIFSFRNSVLCRPSSSYASSDPSVPTSLQSAVTDEAVEKYAFTSS
jgi:hypothetical protein